MAVPREDLRNKACRFYTMYKQVIITYAFAYIMENNINIFVLKKNSIFYLSLEEKIISI